MGLINFLVHLRNTAFGLNQFGHGAFACGKDFGQPVAEENAGAEPGLRIHDLFGQVFTSNGCRDGFAVGLLRYGFQLAGKGAGLGCGNIEFEPALRIVAFAARIAHRNDAADAWPFAFTQIRMALLQRCNGVTGQTKAIRIGVGDLRRARGGIVASLRGFDGVVHFQRFASFGGIRGGSVRGSGVCAGRGGG